MDCSRVGRGAVVRGAIIDRDNDVPAVECIGVDLASDRRRFTVTASASAIVVVPAGFFAPLADAEDEPCALESQAVSSRLAVAPA